MNCFGPSFRPGKTTRTTTTRPRPHISVAMGLMMIVLLVGASLVAEARTTGASNATSLAAEEAFEVGDELPEGETIEWHHVKLEQDGAFRGDHPVIMYKEDFVSEDYDPSKSSGKVPETSSAPSPAAKTSRRYKDIAGHRRRHSMRDDELKYHAVKPEKIYFDVLPLEPVMSSGEDDDDKDSTPSHDSEFDPSKIHVELIPLTPEEEPTGKEELSKRPPKKYHHHRQRRQAPSEGHVLHKRNPYYNYYPASAAANNNGLAPVAKPVYYVAPGPAGQYWNGINAEVPPHMDVGSRFGDDESIVWPIRRRPSQSAPRRPQSNDLSPPRRPNTPQSVDLSPPMSIFHDARPENADTSFLNQGRTTTSRPAMSDPGSIFHSSRPEDANTSFLNPRTTRRPATATRSPLPPPQSQSGPDFSGIFQVPETPARRPAATTPAPARTVSDCVWAIVNCCQASSSDIRYSCFERQGCVGAFWDLNPCADSVRDPIIEYVNNLYSD